MKEIIQQESKRKPIIYVAATILAVIVFSSLIFTLSLKPSLIPLADPPAAAPIKTFSDKTELQNYITANTQGPTNTYRGSPLDSQFFQEKGLALPEPTPMSANSGADSATQSIA